MAAATTTATKAAADQATQSVTRMAEEATKRFEETTERVNKMVEEVPKRFEENTERVKELNAAMMESSKAGTRVVVDTYAETAKNLFELQRQMAGTAQVQWVRDAAHAQIQFAEDITDAWVRAARELLRLN